MKVFKIETIDDLISWLENVAVIDSTITTAGVISVLEHCKETRALPDTWKKCSVCLKILPASLSHFDRRTEGKNGLSSRCRPCRRKYLLDYKHKYKKSKKNKSFEKLPKEDQAEITRITMEEANRLKALGEEG